MSAKWKNLLIFGGLMILLGGGLGLFLYELAQGMIYKNHTPQLLIGGIAMMGLAFFLGHVIPRQQ